LLDTLSISPLPVEVRARAHCASIWVEEMLRFIP
jgi:hypothetical protein